MSFGLNGCSIRFVPRQSIKIAQLTQAPTTFSLYNLDTPGFFYRPCSSFTHTQFKIPSFAIKILKLK